MLQSNWLRLSESSEQLMIKVFALRLWCTGKLVAVWRRRQLEIFFFFV